MTKYENMKGFYLHKTNVVRNKIFVPESLKIFGKAVTPHIDEDSYETDEIDTIEYTYTLDGGHTCGIAVAYDYDDELFICSFIDHENVEENYLEGESNPDEIELMMRRMIDRLEDRITTQIG